LFHFQCQRLKAATSDIAGVSQSLVTALKARQAENPIVMTITDVVTAFFEQLHTVRGHVFLFVCVAC
jgi:hypothetical protein